MVRQFFTGPGTVVARGRNLHREFVIKRLSTYVCYSHARLVLIKCGSCLEESVYQCIIVRVTLCTRHIIYLLTRGCDLPLHEFVSKQTPRIHTKRSRGPLCYRVQGSVERYL